MGFGNHSLLFAAFLVFAAAIDGTQADAMVSGTVFCDQCKDGRVSLFDYPIFGIKVMVSCANGEGQVTMTREETTNWFGSYAMAFDGTPDLSNCYAQVVGGDGQNSMACGVAASPPQGLKLMFRMFDTEFYAANTLLSQPARPASFCPQSSVPAPAFPVTRPMPPPPASTPPMVPVPPVGAVPSPLPPTPLLESACPHQTWMMPQYRCYWRMINPDTKVAVIFGPAAAHRYGTDITLFRSLQGRGDPYKNLLREATTALLNSYNSLQFPYHPLAVIYHMNKALLGSTKNTLHTALSFMRANSGYGSSATCKLTPCQ